MMVSYMYSWRYWWGTETFASQQLPSGCSKRGGQLGAGSRKLCPRPLARAFPCRRRSFTSQPRFAYVVQVSRNFSQKLIGGWGCRREPPLVGWLGSQLRKSFYRLAHGSSGLAGPPLLGLRNGEERPIKLVPIKLRSFFLVSVYVYALCSRFILSQSVSQQVSKEQTKFRGSLGTTALRINLCQQLLS